MLSFIVRRIGSVHVMQSQLAKGAVRSSQSILREEERRGEKRREEERRGEKRREEERKERREKRDNIEEKRRERREKGQNRKTIPILIGKGVRQPNPTTTNSAFSTGSQRQSHDESLLGGRTSSNQATLQATPHDYLPPRLEEAPATIRPPMHMCRIDCDGLGPKVTLNDFVSSLAQLEPEEFGSRFNRSHVHLVGDSILCINVSTFSYFLNFACL
jgi:hypothetical protein